MSASWLLGGGALAAYLWSRGRTSSRGPAILDAPLPGRWVWPVAAWKGRVPVVSDGFYSPREGRERHGGLDIMFPRLPADSFKVGSPNGSKAFVMPDGVKVVAASDGLVWSAMSTSRGYAIVIDHGPRKIATFYQHLETLLVAPTAKGASKQYVRAGETIGVVGFSPLDAAKLKHLHFEVWLGGPSDSVDPEPVMKGWEVTSSPTPLVARNNSSYRPVGARGEPYPQWVRDLKDRSGVYILSATSTRTRFCTSAHRAVGCTTL